MNILSAWILFYLFYLPVLFGLTALWGCSNLYRKTYVSIKFDYGNKVLEVIREDAPLKGVVIAYVFNGLWILILMIPVLFYTVKLL